ncbi:MAG: glycerol kinase GlpK [Melioribacteraceae bacterium]
MEKFILAVDQGTTSSRAIIFDKKGYIKSISQKEFKQFYPRTGWVEHDPNEIWSSQIGVIAEAIASAGLNATSIAAMGITNQRETTVIWDRKTGIPIYNAIVWQDRRTADYCNEIKEMGYAEKIRSKTGLVIDAYFSGTKINWILENVEGARQKAENGELAFGTIDSWLIWNLTNGKTHITDVTNASRTMLYNINELDWDDEILQLLNIPRKLLPEVKSSSEIYAHTANTILGSEIPIAGIAGDQQSALFGQMCIKPGMLKNTYGTGGFLMFNTGDKPIQSNNNLLTTIAWGINGKITYALEGSIFIAGAVVQWLRDELKIINSAGEIEELANSVEDNGGIYMVPAFAGLGAPHWDQFARGAIFGITRGTKRGHIARAALESIAFQTLDVLKAMESDSGIKVSELRVDGGATANNLLMQIQSDFLGIPLVRPKVTETTALGVAYLAGLAIGFWSSIEDIKNQWEIDLQFTPKLDEKSLNKKIKYWNKAVEGSIGWLEQDEK